MERKRPAAIANPSSSALLNTSAPETAGANQETLDTAGRGSAHFLQVWVPSPLGLIVGMADVVADRRAFAANRTMSHWRKSFLITLRHPHRFMVRRPLQLSRAGIDMKEVRIPGAMP